MRNPRLFSGTLIPRCFFTLLLTCFFLGNAVMAQNSGPINIGAKNIPRIVDFNDINSGPIAPQIPGVGSGTPFVINPSSWKATPSPTNAGIDGVFAIDNSVVLGSGPDKSIGFRPAPDTEQNFGVVFQNTTGETIECIKLKYFVEKWTQNKATSTSVVPMIAKTASLPAMAIDYSSLTYHVLDSLEVFNDDDGSTLANCDVVPTAFQDGNNALNREEVDKLIKVPGFSLLNGEYLVLRFEYRSSHFTPTPSPVCYDGVMTIDDLVVELLKPNAPTTPIPVNVGCRSFDITWNNTNSAVNNVGYEVNISKDPTFATLDKSDTTGLSFYSFNNLDVGDIYYFRVRAVSPCGESIYIDGSGLVDLLDLPDDPVLLSADNEVCDDGIGFYEVQDDPGAFFEWDLPQGASIITGVGDPAVEINWDLTPPGTYDVYVRAGRPGCGYSANDLPITVEVKGPPPAPMGITGPETICLSNTAALNSSTYSVDMADIVYDHNWDFYVNGTLLDNMVFTSFGGSSGEMATLNLSSVGVGTHKLVAFTSDPVCGTPSNADAVLYIDITDAAITSINAINGPGSVCGSDTVTFSVPDQAGVDFNWTGYPLTSTVLSPVGDHILEIVLPPFVSTDFNLSVTPSKPCNLTVGATTRTIAIGAPPAGAINSDTTFCSPANMTVLTLSGHQGSIERWEVSTDGCSSFNTISGTGGQTSLFVMNVPSDRCYRAIISATCGNATFTSESDTAFIAVNAPFAGDVTLSSSAICGGSGSVTATLSGNTDPIVRWETSTDNFASINTVAISATTPNELNLNALSQRTGVRAVVQPSGCTETVTPAKYVDVISGLNAGTITPANPQVCGGGSVVLSLNSFDGNVRRWEYSTDGFSTVSTLNNMSSSISVTNVTANVQYRAVVGNGVCADVFSAPVTINVVTGSNGGTLTATASSFCGGSNSGMLQLGNFTGNIIDWQSSLDGTNFSSIGVNTNTYTFSNLTQTTYYRVIVQSGTCSPAFSNLVPITISNPVTPGSIVGGGNVCGANNAGQLVLTGYDGDIVRWESSTDNFNSVVTPIANTNDFLDYSNISQTTQYRAILDRPGCPEVRTNAVSLVFTNSTAGGTATASTLQTCAGNTVSLSLNNFTGAVLKWEKSSDDCNGPWTDVMNASPSLVTVPLTQTTCYRAAVQNASCGVVYSNTQLIQVANPVIDNIDQQNIGCGGATVGSITVNASGGVGALEYSIDNGATYQTSNVFGNLSAGSYLVVVRDQVFNTCASPMQTVTIQNATSSLAIVSITPSNESCSGKEDGGIILNVTGGPPGTGYTFNWSNGATTRNLTNIPAGTYTVTVTDNDGNGCSVVSNPVAVQAGQTLVMNGSVSNVSCGGAANDGAITVSVSGGSSPYNYAWSGAASTTNAASGLAPGTYCVTATDVNGCTVRECFDVTQGANFTATYNVTNTPCPEDANGAIDATVSGGTAPYTFAWSNGFSSEDISSLTAGAYMVTITDANNCSAMDTVEVMATGSRPVGPTGITASPSQPCVGSSVTLNAPAQNNIVYYWYENENSTNPISITGSSITVTPQTAGSVNYYVESSNTLNQAACNSERVAVPLNVLPPSNAGSISGDTEVCATNASGVLTLQGITGSVNRWESSTNGFVTSTFINNTTTSLAYSNLTETTSFRAIVQQGSCTPDTATVEVVVSSGEPCGTITVSSANLPSFGTVVAGCNPSGTQQFTVSANGLSAPLTITPPSGFVVSQTTGGTFSSSAISINQDVNGSVPSTTIFVKADENAAANSYSGNIVVTSAGFNNREVAVAATVETAVTPAITANPSTLSFGQVRVGEQSAPSLYEVTVAGLANAANLVVSAPANFRLSENFSGPFASSLTLPVAGNCASETKSLYVVFEPVAAGASNGAISHSANSLNASVAVSGVGSLTDPPGVTVSTSALNSFGTIAQGCGSAAQSYTVEGQNLTAPVNISAPAGFAISTAESGNYLGALTLSPDGSGAVNQMIYVKVNDAANAGSYSGVIAHSTSGAATQSVAVAAIVSATATPSIQASESNIDYGVVTVGASTVQSYALDARNFASNTNISISTSAPYGVSESPNGPFATALTVTVDACQNYVQTFYVRYRPTADGAQNGTITHNGGGASATVNLTGTGASGMQPEVVFNADVTTQEQLDAIFGEGVYILGVNAFNDLQSAVNVTMDGGTVFIEDSTIQVEGIEVDHPVTIIGKGTKETIIEQVNTPMNTYPADDPEAALDPAFQNNHAFIISSDNVVIKDLAISGNTNVPCEQRFGVGVITDSRTGTEYEGIEIENVRVSHVYSKGIQLFKTDGLQKINNVTVEDVCLRNDPDPNVVVNAAGILAFEPVEITNTTVSEAGTGIYLSKEAGQGGVPTKVENNIIGNIEVSAILADLLDQPNPEMLEIRGNFINGVGKAGIEVWGLNSSSVIENNNITINTVPGKPAAKGVIVAESKGLPVRNNTINASGLETGILLLRNENQNERILLDGNTITGDRSFTGTPAIGESNGILITSNGDFLNTQDGSTYVEITRSNISGFYVGIYGNQEENGIVDFVVGSDNFDGNNEITNNFIGIRSNRRSRGYVRYNARSITGNDIGIEVFGGDVTIEGNRINNNGIGIKIYDKPLAQATAVIFDNMIYDNGVNIKNESANTPNASWNWWGGNSAAVVNGGVDGGTAGVDFSPWLNDSTDVDQNLANGFKGIRAIAHVDDNSAVSTGVSHIGEALNETATQTIVINDGNYPGVTSIIRNIELTTDGSAPHPTLETLSMDNNAVTLNLSSSLNVSSSLALNGGKINAAGSGLLTILDNASVSQGSENSYVVGNLAHRATTSGQKSFYYPIGSASAFRPATLELTQFSSLTNDYVGRLNEPTGVTRTLPQGVTTVSNIRGYNFTVSGQSAYQNGSLTAAYSADDVAGMTLSNIVLLKDNDGAGPSWFNLKGALTGDQNSGAITSGVSFNTLGNFVFANDITHDNGGGNNGGGNNGGGNNGLQPAPVITNVNLISSSSAYVFWTHDNPPCPIAEYQLRYRIKGNTDWSMIGGITSNFRFLSNLLLSNSYEVNVRGKCADGRFTAWSTGAITEFQTAALPTCNGNFAPIPGAIYINNVSAYSAQANWGLMTAQNGQGYIVSYGLATTTPTGWVQDVVCHPNRALTLEDLTPGTRYGVRIRTNCSNCTTALNSTDIRSDWSDVIYFTTAQLKAGLQSMEQKSLDLNVYPNPNNGAFEISFTAVEAGDVQLRFFDASGRNVHSRSVNVQSGAQTLPFELSGFAAGIYLLRAQQGEALETVKIIVE